VYIAIILLGRLIAVACQRPAIGVIYMISLLIGLLITLQTGSAQPESTARRTVWEGVYTAAQAAKGKAAYDKSCVECHRSDLGGSSGVLVNPRLLEHWREDNLYSFFNVIKTTMPRGTPASLTDEAYVEILAFILHANNFPAGADELKVEGLPHIQMEAKSGPQDLPTGSLVHVIGCLAQRHDNAWILERSSKLTRTRNPNGSTI
jgi:cytochrome c5